MIDKKLEANIKETVRFLEFWTKFQELYRSAISSGQAEADADIFISTRELVNKRFEDLMDALGEGHVERVKKCYPIYEILSIKHVHDISDERLAKFEDCWTESFIYLYNLLNRQRRMRVRLEKLNGPALFLKKLFTGGMKNDKA